MKKTLGGDRLGSGSKLSVELHNYERSTHDLGYIWRSTMSAGTLVPFMSKLALPGDTFDIDLDCDIKTHPTIGPLFGSYKVQLDVFQCPIRLYNAMLHNNELGIGMDMSVVKFPLIEMIATPFDPDTVTDLDNAQINPSSLLAYLGIRGIGVPDASNRTRQFNAIPILAYWEIYKNYYANKQEEIGAVIHTPAEPIIDTVNTIVINGTGDEIKEKPLVSLTTLNDGDTIVVTYTVTPPDPKQILVNTWTHGQVSLYDLWGGNWVDDAGLDTLTGLFNYAVYGMTDVENYELQSANTLNQTTVGISTFQLSDIDNMRKSILRHADSDAFMLNDVGWQPYAFLYDQPNDIPNVLSSQEGLGLKTYQSDLFNNWLQTEWIDGTNGINAITAIDTSGGSFTIDTLNLSKKVYDMLNRIAVSGGTYDDWLDAVWAHDRYMRAESPMYMGGLIRELVFQEVVSNAESTDQPLGTLAGKGIMAQKKKGGHIVVKVDEPSYIIGIVSLTPRLDYSQGNQWDVHLKTMDDLHKPALDQIGFQELVTEQMAWWSTEHNGTDWIQRSAGKQPAWINYMTDVNQVRGNFAISSNEMFMTLNRRYEKDATGIKDLTTYIDPSKFNFIFANTALDSQNFWCQIAVDITGRRKMSAKVMPNL